MKKIFVKQTSCGNQCNKDCLFNVGDIVRVTTFGAVFSTYRTAFNVLNVQQYHFPNFVETNDTFCGHGFCLSIPSPTNDSQWWVERQKKQEELKKKNWVVLDICLHEKSMYEVMYLIGNPDTHYGLLIGEEGITLHRKGENKDTRKEYIWV